VRGSSRPIGTHGWYTWPSQWRVPGSTPRPAFTGSASVPDDLRTAVGEREEKFSLKTRDPLEAKRRHVVALAALEQRWANLRAPVRKLDQAQLHQV
jgi:hypothetical protein